MPKLFRQMAAGGRRIAGEWPSGQVAFILTMDQQRLLDATAVHINGCWRVPPRGSMAHHAYILTMLRSQVLELKALRVCICFRLCMSCV